MHGHGEAVQTLGTTPRTCRARGLLAVAISSAAVILVLACGATAATPPVTRPTETAEATAAATIPLTPSAQAPATPAGRAQPRPAGSAACSVPAPPSLIGLGVPAPVRIRVASIGIDSGLSRLDRNADGTIQLPPDLGRAGWYRRGVAPGDLGTAVIVGDVGSPPGPGIFRGLSGVRVGDTIRIQRDDGTELQFTARRSLAFSPAGFPAAEVYAGGPQPELRLITCGGTAAQGGPPASGDVVVFAVLSG